MARHVRTRKVGVAPGARLRRAAPPAAPPAPSPAQAALDAVQRRPREAIALAARVPADAPADERSTAERAVGLALRELNDLPGALRHLRRAVRVADRDGSPRVAALARMSLGYVLAGTGRNEAALRTVTTALPLLTGADAGRARMQRGVVLHYRGRYDEAVRDYTAAIEVARREGDQLLEARARNNRGLLRAHRGTDRDAGDLHQAMAVFHQLGLDLAAADVNWNIGHVAVQRGDVVAAFRTFEAVDAEYHRLAVPRPALLLDRVELLLSVPLVDEAVALTIRAVGELRHRGMVSDLAEALLARARAALVADDLDTASDAAAQARRRFHRQGRHTWAAFARHVELRAEFLRGTRSAALLRAMVRTAEVLDERGWPGPGLVTRIDAARLAAALDRPDRARELLATAGRARHRGTASRRAQGWYALALARRLDGDERGAGRALRRGLAVLDGYRAALGATELRANSGRYGQELADEGLDIAVRSAVPGQVLAWAERWRANALRMRPALPPREPALATALAELRMVSTALEDALLANRPVQALRRSQARLELTIRDLARRGAAGGAGPVASPGVRALSERLGRLALMELVAHGGRALAVVVRDGRATLHDLGPLDQVLHQTRLLRFGLRRLVVSGDQAGAGDTARRVAVTLDDQLLGPVRRRFADRPLVIVPNGALHAVPWSALPTCAGRPVTVAPSATGWHRATGQPVPDGTPVLAAGPRLPAGRAEVQALAEALPAARVLTGAEATADAVTTALDGARLAHIAAHGTFRADNPLFSTLHLADGPLTAYELERLPRAPGCVVLSACDSGLSAVRPGDELMGLAAVLLAAGTRTLVASVLPVPADLTAALMLDLHRRMAAGVSPASALAEAQRAFAAAGDGRAVATAAAFVCFGAG